MGEAFDDQGQFLGSAVGATKEEVFNDLNRRFPNAAVITIRQRGERGVAGEARRMISGEEMHESHRQELKEKVDAIERELKAPA